MLYINFHNILSFKHYKSVSLPTGFSSVTVQTTEWEERNVIDLINIYIFQQMAHSALKNKPVVGVFEYILRQ